MSISMIQEDAQIYAVGILIFARELFGEHGDVISACSFFAINCNYSYDTTYAGAVQHHQDAHISNKRGLFLRTNSL